jgi:ABC-type nitrate/sulfonate/bicarbonate transport system substrate-binding protein
MKRARALAGVAALSAAVVARAGAQTPSLGAIKLGVLPNDDMISVVWGQRNGLFAKAGIDLTVDRGSSNGAAIAAAVMGGAYDIGKSSTTAIIDAHLRGVPFTVIGTAAVYESSKPYAVFIVPKDSPAKTPRDLQNGIIGLSFVRDMGQLAMTKIFDEAGLSLKNVQFTEVPMSAAAAAVEQGRVMAAEVGYPPLQAAMDTGKYRIIPIYNTFGSTFSLSVWFTTKDYVAKHPDVVRGFARTVAEAARYTNAHHDETAPLLAEFSGIPLTTIQRMPRVTNGTGVSVAGIQTLIDAEAKYGFIARGFSARELVDPLVEGR